MLWRKPQTHSKTDEYWNVHSVQERRTTRTGALESKEGVEYIALSRAGPRASLFKCPANQAYPTQLNEKMLPSLKGFVKLNLQWTLFWGPKQEIGDVWWVSVNETTDGCQAFWVSVNNDGNQWGLTFLAAFLFIKESDCWPSVCLKRVSPCNKFLWALWDMIFLRT